MDETTTDENGGGWGGTQTSWGDWTQQVMGSVIDKYTTAQWVQPYNIEQMRLQSLGQNGYYTEGQRNQAMQQGNKTGLLLLGGAVIVALLVLRK